MERSVSGLLERHFLFIDSAAAWMANRKITGARLSPCFTPEVDGKVAFAFPTLVDTSMAVHLFHDRTYKRLRYLILRQYLLHHLTIY
jgi:hypothetical protein